ncbi:MAG: DUF427 domain-containing protein [Pseudomonadota bacterium]
MELHDEDVQTYPRPPALEPVQQRLRVVLGGVVIAETMDGLRVLETHHAPTYYFPPDDVLVSLRQASGGSFCEWKGRATYWDIIGRDRQVAHAAWSYAAPTKRFAAVRDHLAIYAGLVDEAWVGETRVTPQPGDFYGGWVTPNLTGIVKGAPGTRHW